MKPLPKLLSAGQYAEHLGVRIETVSRALRAGKITGVKEGRSWKIDPEVADRQWSINRRRAKVTAPDPGKSTDDQTLHGLELRERRAKARLAELKVEETLEQLIDVEKVKRQAFDCARKTRDAILAIPMRIGHQLAAETDPHQVEVMLEKELMDALLELADPERKRKKSTKKIGKKKNGK